MKLAMYKGPPTDLWHTVAHEGTCLWTWSEYSHAELVFSDPLVNGMHFCASSSARDGGVRFKSINLATGRWDVYELPGFDECDEAYARQWFLDNEGLPYDHLGLAWFVLPIDGFNNPRRYFCSEAIAAALRMRQPHKCHPQRLLDACLSRFSTHA
jgi:hypothetical protein